MKPQTLLSFLLVVFTCVVQAQSFPTFGIPSQWELKMNTCEFDPEADAIVLLHDAVTSYDDENRLITNYHVRLKILRENGLRYADVAIPYYSENNFEIIYNLEGVVIKPNENGIVEKYELDKKSIFNEKTTERIGQVKFTYPNIAVGSIIEYKYTSVMKNFSALEDWYFQREIPVLKSRYLLNVLPSAEFTYVVHTIPGFNVQVNNQPGVVSFQLDNIAALGKEPYMDSRKDYLQRVEFQLAAYGNSTFSRRKYMNTWRDVVNEMLGNSSLGAQVGKSLQGTGEFLKGIATAEPFEKMQKVYDYVQSHFTWNGETSRFSRGIKDAWSKKTGSTADINLSLATLLKDAGLDAAPILVSERHNGKVNPKIPFVDQFNTVMVQVIVNDRQYILDGSDRYAPVNLVPAALLNTYALPIKKKNTSLIEIKDESVLAREDINIYLKMSRDSITGKALFSFRDYARVERLHEFAGDNNEFISQHYRQPLGNGNLLNFETENESVDSLAFINKFDFNIPVRSSGNMYFVDLDIFSGLKTNPFLAKKRFSDINFGSRRQMVANLHVDLPDGINLEELPKNIRLVSSDRSLSFTREVFTDNGKLLVRFRFETAQSLYSAGYYTNIQSFYKKMADALNEQLVLKKAS